MHLHESEVGGCRGETSPHAAIDQPQSSTVHGTGATPALLFAALGFGVRHSEAFSEPALTPFVEYALDRLDRVVRLRIVLRLGQLLERAGREHGHTAGAALTPFIGMDEDLQVVSTAALVLADVWTPQDGDPLTGARQVLQLAERHDGDRRGAVLAGLTQMGDSRVFGLVRSAWASSSRQARLELLPYIANQTPTAAAFEFLVDVLDGVMDDDELVGGVAGSVCRLIGVASGEVSGFAAGRGILDVERTLPTWSARGEVIRIKASYSVAEFAPRIVPRLQALAARESAPHVLPKVLAALGA